MVKQHHANERKEHVEGDLFLIITKSGPFDVVDSWFEGESVEHESGKLEFLQGVEAFNDELIILLVMKLIKIASV